MGSVSERFLASSLAPSTAFLSGPAMGSLLVEVRMESLSKGARMDSLFVEARMEGLSEAAGMDSFLFHWPHGGPF